MALARSIPTSLSLSLQSHKSLDPIDRRQLKKELVDSMASLDREGPRASYQGIITCTITKCCKSAFIEAETESAMKLWVMNPLLDMSIFEISSSCSFSFLTCSRSSWNDFCLWKHQGIMMKMPDIDWLQESSKANVASEPPKYLAPASSDCEAPPPWVRCGDSIHKPIVSYFWKEQSGIQMHSAPWEQQAPFHPEQLSLTGKCIKPNYVPMCQQLSTSTSNLTGWIWPVIAMPWRFPGQPPAL